MRILITGTGRVAFNLGHALKEAGLPPIGVAGRNTARTQALARDLGIPAYAVSDPPECDMIMIAVSDNAISSVARSIPTGTYTLIHTSGASPIEFLRPHERTGVFWPVQTFLGSARVPLKDVPVVIEGSDDLVLDRLKELASALGTGTVVLDHEQRQHLHMAAVFLSNFTVAMVIEAQELLQQEQLPPDLLLPLWNTTIRNIRSMGARAALTGPASRGDTRTIERHSRALERDPQLRELYVLLSERIMGRGGS